MAGDSADDDHLGAGPPEPTSDRRSPEETPERHILRETLSSFVRHGGTLLSGGVAYFALLSAAPLLLIVLEVAVHVVGETPAREELVRGFAAWVGPDGARALASMVDGLRAEDSGGFLRALNIFALLYGSTRLFSNLQRALNQMWDVTPRRSKGFRSKVWRQVKKRVLALFMVFFCGLFLLFSVIFRASVEAARDVLGAKPPLHVPVIDPVLSFLVVTFVFVCALKVLPDAEIDTQDALFGALFAALLFVPGKILIALYIGHKHVQSVFGVAGTIILLMLWAHYSAQIFFLGAAFAAVRARRQGRPIVPRKNAVRVGVLDADS